MKASMPTKVGEFLASGRPVLVNAGLGDLDELLPRYDCGVILTGTSDPELDNALAEIDRLVADPRVSDRCRSLAEDCFDLDSGVQALIELYQAVAMNAATSGPL
jgi:hypothetical protein